MRPVSRDHPHRESHIPSQDHPEERDIELNPTEARQGRFGQPIFLVLVLSVALGLFLLGGVTLLYTLSDDTPDQQPVVTAPEEGEGEPVNPTFQD